MSLPQKATAYLAHLAARRSVYSLARTPQILSVDQIKSLVAEVVKVSPSSFDAKSSRVVLLLGDQHAKYWSTDVTDALTAAIKSQGGDEKAIEGALGRLEMFKPAYGTILVFESKGIIDQMQANIPQYAHMFPTWSEHSSGMLQYNLWTALTQAGYGANLQHYGNLTQDKLREQFNLPSDWMIEAELVFGAPTGEPKERNYDESKETAERVKIFGQ